MSREKRPLLKDENIYFRIKFPLMLLRRIDIDKRNYKSLQILMEYSFSKQVEVHNTPVYCFFCEDCDKYNFENIFPIEPYNKVYYKVVLPPQFVYSLLEKYSTLLNALVQQTSNQFKTY